MPQSPLSATFLSSLLLLATATAWAGPDAPGIDVMPAPADARIGEGRFAVTGSLQVAVSGAASARLSSAVARAGARWAARTAGTPGEPVRLSIVCAAAAAPVPRFGEDESYSLETSQAGISIHAPNDLGAMHGLETLLQLLQHDAKGWSVPNVVVRDRPRFPWRGLLIDVARHWEPVEVIQRNLDVMAAVKLNVLHLHLTDDQGFRIESLTHPELQEKGSDGRFFTQAQMKAIIAYAAERGIRVVPEFDVPGHATSWLVSHPELASLPGPYGVERHWGVFDPVMDPTKEGTYALLTDFLGEMAGLFPDPYMHIGGDENNGVQWNANPAIQAFIRDHKLKDNAGLHTYFNTRVGQILARNGKRLVGWDEILQPGLSTQSVIQSWRGTEALAAAAAQGYDGILSNGYYIDLMQPASEHYGADPVPEASTLTGPQRSHILGGEATMWGEWVDPMTIDSRIWPRTAAIAERLWSPQSRQDVADMYRRLWAISARLAEAGSRHLANRDFMLRRLVGENLDIPNVAALRDFISLIEPAKGYTRGDIQIWGSQLVPLVGIADAAAPESQASQEFTAEVDRLLFGARTTNPAACARLRRTVAGWSVSTAAVLNGLVPSHPALREAVPDLAALAKLCNIAESALQSLATGQPLTREAEEADLKALVAPESNLSATVLPEIPAVRQLVVAAALQAERPSLAPAAWRVRVTEAAH